MAPSAASQIPTPSIVGLYIAVSKRATEPAVEMQRPRVKASERMGATRAQGVPSAIDGNAIFRRRNGLIAESGVAIDDG